MHRQLLVSVLAENTPVDGLLCEHGLSLHLAYGGTSILLDFGQSDVFARNAEVLDVNLAAVDHAVLSHAHYDHADGMPAFFALNDHARLYLSECCDERCWSTRGGSTEAHYIGIKPGLLARYRERLAFVPTDRTTTIAPGVHLVPHTTTCLSRQGRRTGMLLRNEERFAADTFAHEISLVLELGTSASGESPMPLAVFNSCSHAGLSAITAEVMEAFPGARISSFVGGLHLIHACDEDILATADAIRSAGIGHIYTGHCTGSQAIKLLAHALPGRISSLHPGLRLDLAS